MTASHLSTVPPFRDGLFLGVNAVPDIVLVVDGPEGCYFQSERVALNHDRTSTLLDPLGRHRVIQTEVDYGRLPLGTEAALEATIERVVEARSPALVLVTQATMVEVTGNDLEALVERVEARVSVPVRYVKPASLSGDYLDGYFSFLATLVEVLAPERVAAPGAVGVVGYFADRLEEDHRANLRELQRLVEALGLVYLGALCDGSDTSALARTLGAGILIELPHARGLARHVASRTGACVLELPLPIGLEVTTSWLASLGAAAGREAEARVFAERELGDLVPCLDKLRSTCLRGASVVVSHDAHWAAGLVSAMRELSLQVPLVALRRRRGPTFDAEDLAGRRVVVLEDTSVPAFREALETIDPERAVDLVLGPQELRGVSVSRGATFLEIGYPSFTTHAVFPRPLLGYLGARRLADEIANGLEERRWRTNAGRGT